MTVSGPLQVLATVAAQREVGAYRAMTLLAPEVAGRTRPGQFLALAVGGRQTAMVLRRAFSVHRARPDAGTVEVVFSVAGHGTAWLAGRRPGDAVDLVGPLGRPFTVPERPGTSVLVGGGYGAAPLFALADALLARGGPVATVLGAATADRLFGVRDASGLSGAADAFSTVAVTTDDGSAGTRGRVTDVLPDVLRRTGATAVYACGPMAMLAAVADVAAAAGVTTEVAVEESMACGIGVCMTCVLPVRGDDGVTRMVRSCVEGPVFGGDRVRWDALGTVPADALGAPLGAPA